MEIHLAPDTQAQLQQLAASEGKNAAQVVEETVTRMLEQRAQFLQAVREGIAAADRGELIEHEEVWAKVQDILRS